jgi:hypothetical protein
MFKIAVIAVIALSIFAYVGHSNKSEPALAAPMYAVDYTWSYNYTNVYNTEFITYSFTGLNTGTVYRWDVFTTDHSGALRANLGTIALTNVTSTTFQFGGAAFNSLPGQIAFPHDYAGPVVVVDYYTNTTLGKHYIVENPAYRDPNAEWFGAPGNTTLTERQVIGTNQHLGECANPAYGDVNVDGWFHNYTPCSVLTPVGEFGILHYQLPTGITTTNDVIDFYLMPGTDNPLTISMDDIIQYQLSSCNFCGGTVTDNTSAFSFIIVNTNGEPLPFIDNSLAASTFSTEDNPAIASFDPGVYNYVRDDGSWVSDGESVWIISDDQEGIEWSLTGTGQVKESGTMNVTARAVTPEVWDSYSGYQEISDTDGGYSDATIYAFATSRTHNYQVSGTVSDGVLVEWIQRASGINSNLATVSDMEFIVSHTYDIIDVLSFEENVNVILTDAGLNSDAGRAFLMTLVLFSGMLGTAGMTGLTKNIYAYLVVWTGLGAMVVLGGFSTLLVTTVWTFTTIGMWVFAMLIGGVISEEEA